MDNKTIDGNTTSFLYLLYIALSPLTDQYLVPYLNALHSELFRYVTHKFSNAELSVYNMMMRPDLKKKKKSKDSSTPKIFLEKKKKTQKTANPTLKNVPVFQQKDTVS